jgi:KaiC/GvpD/RAD55 family RecA-like ATPase
MDYQLAIENTPETIPGGTGVLLLHPSTGETDRIDTDFLKTDTDHFLVISTRTTAREVKQKLDHYDVDESKAEILDTLSIERGYSRRSTENVHYVSSPDDLDGVLDITREFLETTDGKRRISLDSITEMAYYADESRVRDVIRQILGLLREHDAVGLFHLSKGVHDEEHVEKFMGLFDAIIDLDRDGEVNSDFEKV